jgi:predicted PurR-regulated permease PerM
MHSIFYRRSFQLVTAAILGYALYLRPLRSELGWAAVLAFILYPPQEWLARRLKGRRALAAGILTALTPFCVLAPLSVLGVVFAGQVARMIESLRAHSFMSLSYADVLDRLTRYPVIGSAVAWVRENAAISFDQVQGWITDSLQALRRRAATSRSACSAPWWASS